MSTRDEREPVPEDVRAAYGKLPTLRPPPALDERVLAQARAAATTAAVRKPRAPWIIPFATAASAVLAIGLGWRLSREQGEQAFAPAVTAPAPTIETQQRDVVPADAAGETPAADPDGPSRVGAARGQEPVAAPAEARPGSKDRGAASDDAPTATQSAPVPDRIAPTPAQPPPAAAPAKPAPIVHPPEPFPQAEVATESAAMSDLEDERKAQDATAPVQADFGRSDAPAAPAPQAAVAERQRESAGRENAQFDKREASGLAGARTEPESRVRDQARAAGKTRDAPATRVASEAPPADLAAPRAQPASPAAAPARVPAAATPAPFPSDGAPSRLVLSDLDRKEPERWLAGVRRLFERGQRDDARRELRDWSARHPALRVPDDLKPLLE